MLAVVRHSDFKSLLKPKIYKFDLSRKYHFLTLKDQ